MAHSCPECGLLCHCNGDIDDCCFDFEEDVIRCDHCEEEDADRYEDFSEDADDWWKEQA